MKIFIFLNIILTTISLFGQDTRVDCYEFMQLEQNAHFSDTTFLSNGSKLYYQWNCDSTWLTFENDKKIILKSCSDVDPIICSRLGLQYIKEYPNYLLFVHNWVSGCCTPPDIVFHDKETGLEKKRITKDLFVWGDVDHDYALYFSDSTYSTLKYINHKLNHEISYRFKENEVLKSTENHSVLKLSNLFNNFRIVNGTLIFDFKNKTGYIEEIRIKLNE